jgi:hypothetical protein
MENCLRYFVSEKRYHDDPGKLLLLDEFHPGVFPEVIIGSGFGRCTPFKQFDYFRLVGLKFDRILILVV